MEKTFVMVKPDGVQRGLIGQLISRFEQKGLRIKAAKLMQISDSLAKTHYAEHDGKPFFPDLIHFITSGPVFAMVLEGDEAITAARQMMGKTNPLEALPGTIRFDFGLHTNRNIIHGSDSAASAEREIGLFFQKEELLDYEKATDSWL
ncbi:nucleoside-diphosphate kinase [Listeria fleischmannii]|jgi:nucleoside-diphosphate kinase|uniref:Nucleoside diphosphate kinase n=2 Tax=Listeria fleischmannii TaxID=1069827 RepID=W7DLQ9_9LIST|nr:nucleoside-diphosphate kinase [Listeria fleischmannii]EIA20907.1 mulitfunctional nucleoside diphosphate kinase/apyrimidinic endonuclease/3'-phosphodiesterase [Listeria fleischmannii subsp. coloradonensis]EUJ54385.1 multifunctional nucleoside diphosphate kinase/apyrimidinic endonuclease/3'-phosphodiesterase [Listeria fleischmannii FSL S10-1203]MBC1398213.1 nucleoside-diphosphate kinase [Listeria fleischmannii]MBC1418542.1 nucleoside-diphosphate kinase [Listeria fleischmannii]MBC1426274.1 nuc